MMTTLDVGAAATAALAGAAAVVRARTGPATSEPMVPIVRMAGARMFRRMRMIALHAFTEVNCLRPGSAALKRTSLFVHQSLADYIARINRCPRDIQRCSNTKTGVSHCEIDFTSITFDDSGKLSQFDAAIIAMQVAAQITKK
jgi:hypothetical protein